MVIIKVRYKNIVSNYIHRNDDEIEALEEAIEKFERIFGKKYQYISSSRINENPFKLKLCLGIRDLVLNFGEHL